MRYDLCLESPGGDDSFNWEGPGRWRQLLCPALQVGQAGSPLHRHSSRQSLLHWDAELLPSFLSFLSHPSSSFTALISVSDASSCNQANAVGVFITLCNIPCRHGWVQDQKATFMWLLRHSSWEQQRLSKPQDLELPRFCLLFCHLKEGDAEGGWWTRWF